jgi:VWFA-related protein
VTASGFAATLVRRGVSCLAALLLIGVSAGAAEMGEPAERSDSPLAGKSLSEALTELQEGGLKLIFSDRVVRPEMRVEEEPEAGSAKRVLEQLLAAHGLEARTNPTGWLVVVRIPPGAMPGSPPDAPAEPVTRPQQKVRVSDAIAVTPGVQVAVNVIRDGGPVRGLEMGDFEVLVGGERQPILDLEVVDLDHIERFAEVAVSDLPSHGRRHFLLTFDTGGEVAGSLSRAGDAAHRLVREGFHPADLVGVATLSRNQDARFSLGFTSDRRAAAATIDAVTGRNEQALVTDPLGLLVEQVPAGAQHFHTPLPVTKAVLPPDKTPGRVDEHGYEDGVLDLEREVVRTERDVALGRLLALSESMTALARVLQATPGRKDIVLFTEGFSNEVLAGLSSDSLSQRNRIEEINNAIVEGEYWRVNPDERYGSVTALSSFDRMLKEFSRGGSVIHPVDTRLAVDSRSGPRSQDALYQLAGRTGGTYAPGTGGVARLLEALVESSSVTYLLRFTTPEAESTERLRVKLRRGLAGKVLHPPTYSEAVSLEASPLERRLRGADLIIGGRDGGEFQSEVVLESVTSAGDHSSIEVSVSAEICSLPGACEQERQADIYVYALATDGAIGDYFARGVTLAGRAIGEKRLGFRVQDMLELSDGSYNIRALIVDRRTGATSLTTVPIEVDASGQG